MHLKKGSYVHNQLTFGLLGLSVMADSQMVEATLSKGSLQEARETIEPAINDEFKDLLDLIFDDLFVTEDDMERIKEVFESMLPEDVVGFINSYRHQDKDIFLSTDQYIS